MSTATYLGGWVVSSFWFGVFSSKWKTFTQIWSLSYEETHKVQLIKLKVQNVPLTAKFRNTKLQKILFGVSRLLNQNCHLTGTAIVSSQHLPFSCQSTAGLNVPWVILYGAEGEVCRYLGSRHAAFHVLLVCKDENCSLL